MIHSIVPYDDIFPTEIASPRFVREGDVIREYRDDGLGFDTLSRIYATDLWVYLRPFQ